MRMREPGKVKEGLFFLGCEESCVYLLEGNNEAMIISGGMSYLVPDVLQQFEAFGIDEGRITKLLILHSHFDHVGIVPFFKDRHPEMEIYASARAWEILRMPKAITTVNRFSRDVAARMGLGSIYDSFKLDWHDDISGEVVSEGDCIDLGDMVVNIYETPGHSSCSISAYVPKVKALFPSDGGGIPYKEMILASGNSNFTKFQHSLDKLSHLDSEVVCADHYGYISGDEARNFIQQSIVEAKKRRAWIEETYLRTGDIETVVQEMADSFYNDNPGYILTPEIMKGVFRQMVRNIVDAASDSSQSHNVE